MTTTTATTYTIASLKTFRGRQGQGFSATLLADGRKVATVTDEANGGAYWFTWLDKAAEAELDALAASLPKRSLGAGYGDFQPDRDTVLDDMVQAEQLRKLLATKVVMARPDGEVVTLTKVKPTPDVLAMASARYPDHKLLNGLAFADAFAIYSALPA